MSARGLVAVDLFAGTGWGVAARRLGIEEHGVELMPEAIATREANGMATWMQDVWDVLEHAPVDSPEFRAALLIASPPCQTFSMAGGGAGRRALDEVLALIESRAYLNPAELRAFGEAHDPRTALVLTPLTYIARHTPTYVVLEQVPPVLPVWERIADELRKWGYSAWVGILSAEQYGVPQTRKRAVLIARADGYEASPPLPSHSRYYPHSPARLDEGVEPWVSMAEALGWGMTERPYMTVTSGTDPAALGGSGARRAVLAEKEAGRWLVSNYSTESASGGITREGSKHKRTIRPDTAPALTVTGNVNRNQWIGNQYPDSKNPSKPAERQRRDVDKPAPTITSGSRSAKWGERVNDQSGTVRDAEWPEKRPATTIATRDLVADPGHNASRFDTATKSRNDGIKVTADEAAALQSYPPGFEWRGSKTAIFRQIGNAVPPLLAEAILTAVTSREGER